MDRDNRAAGGSPRARTLPAAALSPQRGTVHPTGQALVRWPRALACFAWSVLLIPTAPAQSAPAIVFNGNTAQPVFELRNWDAAAAKAEDARPDWRPIFAVFVAQPEPGSDVPPLTGSYRLHETTLVFEPRYPLQPGLQYQAVFHPQGETTPAADALTATFTIPKPDATPVTFVEQVYPTTDRLPENQLKLYVHFSGPMSRGEAYRRVALLDADGKPVSLPFLELEQELWDPEGKRLTLLFDPGRVKRDLLPNREVGSPLREGRRYTLVIDSAWRDAAGRPLQAEFRKPFEAGPPDHDPPSESNWQITPPRAATSDPLIVAFPEPLDEALLERVIHVTTPSGERIGGAIEIDQHETRWRFRPNQAWKPGDYLLDAATLLEDLAGNSLERPFEVDVFGKVEDRIERVSRTVRFRIAP
jgi:hypothetical protein